jgi:hypothetical protein
MSAEVSIGFSTTNSLISRAIRAFTGESVSHSWILHEAYGGQYVMQAEWSGFQVVSWSHFRAKNKVVEVVPVSQVLATRGIDARARVMGMAEYLGDAYDFWAMLAHLIPPLIRLASPTALICTEAIVRCFPELFPNVNPEKATPGQLRSILNKMA